MNEEQGRDSKIDKFLFSQVVAFYFGIAAGILVGFLIWGVV